MKILFISDPGTIGGAAKALLELTITLKKMGIEPIVCTSVLDGLNNELDRRNIKNFACGHESAMNPKSPYKWKRPLKYPYECGKYYLSLPNAIKKIERQIELDDISIIHTNSARNDIGCILNKKYNIPHIIHIREFGQEDFDCRIFRPNYYSFISTYSTKLVAISNAVGNSWIKKGIDPTKTMVIYDGVDIESIKVKKVYNNSDKPLKMIIAGGVCEPKGQHIVIEAIGLLNKNILSDTYLDVAGWPDPRYEDKLKKRITELQIQQQVRFLGTRNDLYDIYQSYDIGLTCSKSEGFGRVTAEYLYAGLAVIGANTGATPELIRENETGLIFDYPNPKSLADCIEKLYYDRELIEKIGEEAHLDAERFSAKRNASEILNLYNTVISGE